jgi:predicted transcriptional regulator
MARSHTKPSLRYTVHIGCYDVLSSRRPLHQRSLDRLVKNTGRSRSFLAAEAIFAYLDTNERQVAGITKVLSSLDRGKGIAHVSQQIRVEPPGAQARFGEIFIIRIARTPRL